MSINHIFNSQAKTITFAAILVGFSSAISAALGIFRDRLLAGRFGAGEELDVYFAAFRVPDFVYGILVVGGLTATFLPIFSEYFQLDASKKEENSWPSRSLELANNILNCFLILLVLLCSILFIFAPLITNLIAPGFSSQQKILTTTLTRIMFLSPILLGISNIFSGILQYFNRFLVYSLAPIFYNLGIIVGILFFVPIFGLLGLSYGVIFGAFLHLIIQIPSIINTGYRYRPFFNFRDPGLLQIFKLMIPRLVGQVTYQLNLVVITAIASTLNVGSIAIFNFSNNFQWFPVSMIGISFAIAVFPALSRSWANHHPEEFFENLFSAFRQIIFLMLPISLLVFILRAQLVRLVLGTGHFGWWETRLTAASIGVFSFGIIAASLTPLITRAFFSIKDTKTPVVISIASMSLNIGLAFLFTLLLKWQTIAGRANIFRNFIESFLKLQEISNIEIIGLPLALAISGVVQCALLCLLFSKKIKKENQDSLTYWQQNKAEILDSFKKIVVSCFLMVSATYLSLKIVALFVNMRTFLGVFAQTLISATIGIFGYLFAVWVLKTPELKIIKSSFLKQFSKNV